MPNPSIIYEDENVLVINKPAGLSVHHDDRGEPKETLVEWLVENYPEIKNVGEELRPGLVHRLDKDTSGVMITAKNQATFEFLKQQFKNRETKKVYRAILSGQVNLAVGEEKVLDWPIGRSANDPRIRVARSGGKGKLREAVTVFRLIENLGDKYAYVSAEPKTGRTHQLRAHFKAYSHPIIGDTLYNPKDNGNGAIKRQALHAYSLTVKLPAGEHTFEAPLPADFTEALEKLKAVC